MDSTSSLSTTTARVLATFVLMACYLQVAHGFSTPSLASPAAALRRTAGGVSRAAGRTQQEQTAPEAFHEQGTRRTGLISRRGRIARPPRHTTSPAGATDQQLPSEKFGDVGDLFRIEVAQRLKEIKLMTQPETVPPATTQAGYMGPEALGDISALERQISLLSSRIKSIADHLQVTPTDAVSRKGLVALVKRRRFLLETLRHRDNERWLATTESLGLRQRPDVSSAASNAGQKSDLLAARRARRRDRGKARREGHN